MVGCGLPVSYKGGKHKSYVNHNPQISAVVSALESIEAAVSKAPDRWWEGSNVSNDFAELPEGDDCKKKNVVHFEQEEDEIVSIVDFQKIMDDENEKRANEKIENEEISEDGKRKRSETHHSDDDESSTTKEVAPKLRNRLNMLRDISFDQSLSPTDEHGKLNQSCAIPQNFSLECSPIAMQSSQPTDMVPELRSDLDVTKASIDTCRKTASSAELNLLYDAQVKPSDDGRKLSKDDSKASAGSHFRSSPKDNAKGTDTVSEKQQESHAASPKKPLTIQSTNQKSRRASRVSFQPQPKVLLLYPSWTLKPADARSLRKCISDDLLSILKMPHDAMDNNECELDMDFDFDTEVGRESFLMLLSSHRGGDSSPAPLSSYAVSTEQEYATCDGIVIPISFRYYLAVACGLPIVDIEFLSSALKEKRSGKVNHQRFPFPSSQNESAFRVISAADYSWHAPQKAQAAALERHTLWKNDCGANASSETLLPGTDLLNGYTIIMIGQYDQPAAKKVAAKRRKQRFDETRSNCYTKGNIALLLQLTGARVYDVNTATTLKHLRKGAGLNNEEWAEVDSALPLVKSNTNPTLNNVLESFANASSKKNHKVNNVVALVRDKTNLKFGREFLDQYFSFASLPELQIPLVTCEWLLDSIGDFEAKQISSYMDCTK